MKTEKVILLFAALLGLTLSIWADETQLTTGWDAGMSRWGDDGHRNMGGNTTLSSHPTDPEAILLKFDVSSLGSGITVTNVSCSLKMGWSGSERSFIIHRITTDWTEGVEVSGVVSDGNPGCTYSLATDTYPSGTGDAGDVSWAASLFGSGDYTSTIDSTTAASTAWVVFDSSALNAVVEAWVNETYSNYGFALWCTNPASDRDLNTFEAASNKPRMWVTYTTGAAGAGWQGQVIPVTIQ